jgi:hypothetical protein
MATLAMAEPTVSKTRSAQPPSIGDQIVKPPRSGPRFRHFYKCFPGLAGAY